MLLSVLIPNKHVTFFLLLVFELHYQFKLRMGLGHTYSGEK